MNRYLQSTLTTALIVTLSSSLAVAQTAAENKKRIDENKKQIDKNGTALKNVQRQQSTTLSNLRLINNAAAAALLLNRKNEQAIRRNTVLHRQRLFDVNRLNKKNIAQDKRLDALEKNQGAPTNAAAVKRNTDKNTSQDTAISGNRARGKTNLNAIRRNIIRLRDNDTKNASQDKAINAVEKAVKRVQGQVDNLGDNAAAQDQINADFRTKNTSQDGAINAVERKNDAQDKRLTAIEDRLKGFAVAPPAGGNALKASPQVAQPQAGGTTARDAAQDTAIGRNKRTGDLALGRANRALVNTSTNANNIKSLQGTVLRNLGTNIQQDKDIKANAAKNKAQDTAIKTNDTRSRANDVRSRANAAKNTAQDTAIKANTKRSTDNATAIGRNVRAITGLNNRVKGLGGGVEKNINDIEVNRGRINQNASSIASLKQSNQEIYRTLEKHARGIAIATTMPEPHLNPGEQVRITGALGGFGGETAIGFAGIARVNQHLSVGAGIAADTGFNDVGWKVQGSVGW